jgi:hypothetical protein
VWQPLIERADVAPEREDLRARQVETGSGQLSFR